MELTDNQKKRLKIHSKKHTKQHISIMRREMKKGLSFKKAHDMAMGKARSY
tara:strand:- start:654 stop:806 length:153 start_codon:yes stop_codon:yes gene_type:complete